MAEYLCPSCHDVVQFDGIARVAWCDGCGQPLTLLDMLPVRPGVAGGDPQATDEERPAAPA
jgi:hypothetical protein